MKQSGKENVIMDWWGLPKSNIINQCDYVIYIDIDADTRLEALKRREKYITQAEIANRDDVLSVDYDSYEYDMVILNDHYEKTVNEALTKIQENYYQKIFGQDSVENKFFLSELSNMVERGEDNVTSLESINQDKSIKKQSLKKMQDDIELF